MTNNDTALDQELKKEELADARGWEDSPTALLPIPKNREIWTFSEAEKLCAWYSENFETISLVLHNTRPTAPQNAALGVDRQSVDQETVTNEMIAAALEESLAVMKEYNVDALSPFADYPPPSEVVKRAITAALKVRPTAPQNAEALEAFDSLINLMNEHCETYSIETLEQDYGDDVSEAIKTIRAALQSPARPVVKPLVWVDYEDDGMKMCVLSIAKCIFGQYQIRRDSQGRLWPEGTKMLNETFRNTIDEAKAAAEAHWQAKIGECLG